MLMDSRFGYDAPSYLVHGLDKFGDVGNLLLCFLLVDCQNTEVSAHRVDGPQVCDDDGQKRSDHAYFSDG